MGIDSHLSLRTKSVLSIHTDRGAPMRMTVGDRVSRIPLALATIALVACSSGENATTDTTAKAPDSAAAAPAMFASAGATDSMETPESVGYDADVDAYFVANINGNPSAKDGNGF